MLWSGDRLTAFVSYSDQTVRSAGESKDPVGRLFQEVSLRGFDAFRDVSSLRTGEFNEEVISDRLAQSDVYLPVVDQHFLESDFCKKEFALANSPKLAARGLSVVPIFVGLGDSRDQIEKRVWPELHYSVKAHWTGLIGDILTGELSQRAALESLKRVLPPNQGTEDDAIKITLISRGSFGGSGFIIDASGVFDESAVEVGSTESWARLGRAVADVEKVIRAHTAVRAIEFKLQCHLSAAVILGFNFRENAGWRISVTTAHGVAHRMPSSQGAVVSPTFEPGQFSGSGGVVAVAADLADRSIAEGVRHAYAEVPRGFIWDLFEGDGSMHDHAAISPTAIKLAHAMRKSADEHRVDALDLFLCGPTSFAVFLGTRLGSLGAPIRLQEWDKAKHRYQPVFELKEADIT